MEKMDSFTLAVLIGGALVIFVFVAMMVLDKKRISSTSGPASGPAKPTGK